MLIELVELYQTLKDNGVVFAPIGHCDRSISWWIDIDREGRLINPELVHSAGEDDRKPKHPVGTNLGKRRTGTAARSYFLVDNASYIFEFEYLMANSTQFAQEMEGKTEGTLKKWRKRHPDFQDPIRRAAGDLNDPAVRAVALFIDSGKYPQIPEELTKDDWIGFRVDGVEGSPFPHLRPTVQEYWTGQVTKDKRQRSMSERGEGMCMFSLERTGLLRKVGGHINLDDRAKLVCSNNDVFDSWQSSGKDWSPAPMSYPHDQMYDNALSYLLDNRRHHYVDYNNTGDRYVWWVLRDGETVELDFTSLLQGDDAEAKEERISSMLREVHGWGDSVVDESSTCFFAVLNNHKSRVVIKHFSKTKINDVARNLDRWYEDLSVCDPDCRKSTLNGFSISKLARVCAPVESSADKKKGHLQARFKEYLFETAVHGAALPTSLVEHAIDRILREVDEDDLLVSPERAALLKLHLTRQGHDMTVTLDDTQRSFAHRLGRFLALTSRAQYNAWDKVLNNVESRFLNLCLERPTEGFQELSRTFIHATTKLGKKGSGKGAGNEKDGGGLGYWFQREAAKFMDLESAGEQLKRKPFTTEEKAEFMAGWFHELNRTYSKEEEHKGSENEDD